MMVRGLGVAIASVIVLSACAQPQRVWTKPGANQQEFSGDRYACMQESQQRVSGSYVNAYAGTSTNQVITNQSLFTSCLNARGWYLGQKPASIPIAQGAPSAPAQVAVHPIKLAEEEAVRAFKDVCLREDLKAYMQKTACNSNDTTLEQMTDSSRITAEQKETLSKTRTATQEINARLNNAYLKYGGNKGVAVVAARERNSLVGQEYQLQLYEGKITWGEFNKARYESGKRGAEEFRNIISAKQ